MRTIHKYPIDVLAPPGMQTVSLPGGDKARVRAVGRDPLGLATELAEAEEAICGIVDACNAARFATPVARMAGKSGWAAAFRHPAIRRACERGKESS